MNLYQVQRHPPSKNLKQAYNLDGGQSAQMYVGTKCYNNPENGGRKISDMLIIVEPSAEELERNR